MSGSILVEDERGERSLGERDFPLVVGAGADATLRVPGPDTQATGGEALAYIGLAEDHPFVQAASTEVPVRRNGEAVVESQWIEHGDSITVGDAVIRCELGDGAWRFTLLGELPAPQLTPPSGPPPAPPPQATEPPAPAVATPERSRRRPSRALSGVVALVFATLLAGVGFVFTAVPVSLEIEPPPEILEITGVIPAVELRGRRLMLPGSYQVSAALPGYHPLDADIHIEWGEQPGFRFEMKKLPGIVSIQIRPHEGARIKIDGQDAGVAPLAPRELEAGAHTLSVEAERYLPYQAALEVEGLGREQIVDVALTPAWAPVSFSSQPPGASVQIAGEDAGETPLEVELMRGSYDVALTKEGYAPQQLSIEVLPNVPQSVPTFELREASGVLELASRPGGATVTVNGKFRGGTPLRLELEPGVAHTLRLSKPGFVAGSRRVSLTAGEQRSLSVSLKEELGVVFLTSTPADAQLAVDGRVVGRATRRLELSTIEHTIEISKKGYAPYKATITPRAQDSQKLTVVLEATTSAARSTGTTADAARSTGTTAEGQALKLIRGGRFQMGASRRDQGRRSNESVRNVRLSRAFYIGVKEVSNDEFRRFKPSHQSGNMQGLGLGGGRQPVAMVSWEDAARYMNWLSEKDSLPPAYQASGSTMAAVTPMNTGYRLPTEAEWSFVARYAARPPPPKYAWGSKYPPRGGKLGNYADASASSIMPNVIAGYTDGHAVSAPVGSFKANPLGIFDLGGNVAEWCHDYYGIYPASQKLEQDPLGRASGKHHVVRGASWRTSSISELRLTYRDYSAMPRMDLGFRVARYVE